MTYRYPHKCMACGLHFNVYSWSDRWPSEHNAYCPECGSRNTLQFGVQELEQEIFQLVPGL